jgi:thioredoxin
MTEITSSELKEKIASGEKFLVDYYATWCGPCKMLKNILSQTESELTVPVYTYDVDSDHDFTSQIGIRSVPTVKLYDGGKDAKTRTGVMNPQQIKEFIG